MRIIWWIVAAFAGLGAGVALAPQYRRRQLIGPSMLKTIASEARTPEEYARRIEAWNAAEATQLPIASLAKAYRGAKPTQTAQLIRQAQEDRLERRERLWSKMSRGLRGHKVRAWR